MKLRRLLAAKALASIVLIGALASCVPAKPKPDQEYLDRIIKERYVDLCDPKAMPSFPYRPKRPTAKDFEGLDNRAIDYKLKSYIGELEGYQEKLIDVIVKTRSRVQQCR